jgi:hypothetical protein
MGVLIQRQMGKSEMKHYRLAMATLTFIARHDQA